MKYIYFLFLLTSLFFNKILAQEPTPYKVFLKPGTVLTRLSDKEDFRITQGIYANVLETKPDRRDHFIVYDKNNKAVYETTALGVVEIDQDVRILPNIDARTTYPAPSIFKASNQNAFFDTQFNLHLDSIGASVLENIYQKSLANALGSRYEIRTLYNSALPVNFGLALNYETSGWSDEIEELKLSILSFGPQIQHYFHEDETMAASLIFGAEYAPVYRISSGTEAETFKAMIINIGVEALWPTDFGKWSLGTHFRRHDLTLTKSTRTNLENVPEDIAINSIGAMIGYKYEWDL